jgi:hypothetical protein
MIAPASTLANVVLPEPLGPMTPNISPGAISNEMPNSTG